MSQPVWKKSRRKRLDSSVVILPSEFASLNIDDPASEEVQPYGFQEIWTRFYASESSSQQLACLKEVNAYVHNEEANLTEGEQNTLQKALAWLTLSPESSHQIRSLAIKVLSGLGQRSPALEEGLESLLAAPPTPAALDVLEFLADHGLGCGALLRLLPQLMRFMQADVGQQSELVCGLTSPVELAAISGRCQRSARLVMVTLQALQPLSPPHQPEAVLAVREPLERLLTRDALPWDLRGNCGMAYVLLCLAASDVDLRATVINAAFPAEGEGIVGVRTVPLAGWPLDAQLALLAGVVHVLPTEQLAAPADSGGVLVALVLGWLVVRGMSVSDTCSLLGFARAVLSALGRIGQATGGGFELSALLPDVLVQDLLQFVWRLMSDDAQSVRNVGVDVLSALVGLFASHPDGAFLTELAASVLALPLHLRRRCRALRCLLPALGVRRLLAACPELPRQLITALRDPGVVLHAVDLYCLLVTEHARLADRAAWLGCWVDPLFESDELPAAALAQIIRRVVQLVPAAAAYVARRITARRRLPRHLWLVLLTAVQAAHRQGALTTAAVDETWRGALPMDRLRQALRHREDEVRIAALTVLSDSQKTSEPFDPVELRLIVRFVAANMANQTPAFRQQLTAVLKKILQRLVDGTSALLRQVSEAERKPGPPDGSLAPLERLQAYETCLRHLFELSFTGLFPGANFPRRCTSLQLLSLVEDFFGDTGRTVMCTSGWWDRDHLLTMLHCLGDCYENNKEMALRFVVAHDLRLLELEETDQQTLLGSALTLASSPRPPDPITAAYLLRAFCRLPGAAAAVRRRLQQDEHRQRTSSEDPEDPEVAEDAVSAPAAGRLLLELLVARLNSEVTLAAAALTVAAAEAPMHGLLLCVRLLLADSGASCDVTSAPDWRGLGSRLVSLCQRASAAVLPVVSSSSPEGHLPMDRSAEAVRRLGAALSRALTPAQADGVRTSGVTAQMLLICSWRTMKEICLLLGDISQKMPVSPPPAGEATGLAPDQLLDIGRHFIGLLAETKHRGAFEQAYVGFSRVCHTLWKSPLPELNQMPCRWLDEVIADIRGEGRQTLCATRRSAGLPFLMQALLTSEPSVIGSAYFSRSMNSLLAAASQGGETCVHAMNVLRALYRDARLGESVGSYVTAGIKTAISGFRADNCAERNSAALLFASLVTRVFGVQRSRDTLAKKNCMTGRLFFLRYPELYPFLLAELEGARDPFPVLLLLARLYPSPVEGNDSQYPLKAFLPALRSAAASIVLQARVLAARAICSLLPYSGYPDATRALLDELERDDVTSQNLLHGRLLQVLYMLRHCVVDTSAYSQLDLLRWRPVVGRCLQLSRLITAENPCPVTRAAACDVLAAAARLGALLSTPPPPAELAAAAGRLLASPPEALYGAETAQAAAVGLLWTLGAEAAVDVVRLAGPEPLQRHLQLLERRLAGGGRGEDRLCPVARPPAVLDALGEPLAPSEAAAPPEPDRPPGAAAALLRLLHAAAVPPACLAAVLAVLRQLGQADEWAPLVCGAVRRLAGDEAVPESAAAAAVRRAAAVHDETRAALLRLAVIVMDGLDHRTEDLSAVLDAWCRLVSRSSGVEEPLDVRRAACEATAAALRWPAGRLTVPQEVSLWKCLVTLLSDDEADVRDSAADVVDALESDAESPPEDDSSWTDDRCCHLQRAVAAFCGRLAGRDLRLTILTLLEWTFTDDDGGQIGRLQAREVVDAWRYAEVRQLWGSLHWFPLLSLLLATSCLDEDRVFDKGEMNIHSEDVMLVRAATGALPDVLAELPEQPLLFPVAELAPLPLVRHLPDAYELELSDLLREAARQALAELRELAPGAAGAAQRGYALLCLRAFRRLKLAAALREFFLEPVVDELWRESLTLVAREACFPGLWRELADS